MVQNITGLALLLSSLFANPQEIETQKTKTLQIKAVGVIQLGRAWPLESASLPPNDGADMFSAVFEALQGADITFGNLETVVSDTGKSKKCKKGSKICYAFRVPTSFTKVLKDTGFDLLSIANNHTADFGEEGRQATVEALDKAGIMHSGPLGDVASFERHGLKIAMIAFGTGGGLHAVQDIPEAVRLVKALDKNHDLIIVSYHAGAEGRKAVHVPHGTEMFYGEDRGDLRAFSTAVIDAGADLILGHGPHVLRAMQVYKNRLIAYSLGNFTSWNSFNLRGPLGISGVLNVELARDGALVGASITPVVFEATGRPIMDPKGKAIPILRKLSKEDFGEELFDAQGVLNLPVKTVN
ncbi:MAG: capsule biosynthesis protein CapA [Myxococcales bacterium]|nr:capsule biosynthesis protein CapA [Myxococcales bacterium]